MNEQSQANLENSQSSQENNPEVKDLLIKERELALKEREIALKEREAEHKSQLEKKNIWFTSPLLIALSSTIFGIIGTVFGAALQGYSNFQLERQKFEFSLIQKSLEFEDDNIITSSDNRKEAAKKLFFLVESGIIQSLNSNSIKKLAENPDDLPSYSRGPGQFFCQIIDDVPTTVVVHPNRGIVKFIIWNSDYFSATESKEERCVRVSKKFQEAQTKGILNYLVPGKSNGYPVICAASQANKGCDLELFKLNPGADPNSVIQKLSEINIGANASPLNQ